MRFIQSGPTLTALQTCKVGGQLGVKYNILSIKFLTVIFFGFLRGSEAEILRKDVIVNRENDPTATRSQTHLD